MQNSKVSAIDDINGRDRQANQQNFCCETITQNHGTTLNLDEYERFGRARYQELSAIVKDLLERAITAEQGYRLQQVQHRAKTVESLTCRLKEIENIESYRKDLGGCRIIFYTNNDVNKFTSSGILSELFDIDRERSKFHQPRPGEKSSTQFFQSYNYVLKLKSDRTDLLEYREFDGLYCEVQVQTSLNHAWAEMAHDTIYKQPEVQGFGARALKLIERRLEDTMRKHLLPAGYLFQRIASDVQRLTEGKKLFDAGALDAVLRAKNNNDRHEVLTQLEEDVLPHYDDLRTVYPEIHDKLKEAWVRAGNTETVPHETPFGSFEGTEPYQVTAQIANIIEQYWPLDGPEETYVLIRDLYHQESDAKSRDQLIGIAERLASHTLQIWQRCGPEVQVRLAEALSNEEDITAIAPLVITIASEILKPDITGTTSSSSSVTFHRGVVVHSEALGKARRTALDIIATYAEDVVADDESFQSAIETLFAAGRKPHHGTESPEIAAMIRSDLAYAVERISAFASEASLNARQDIESQLLHYWRWNKSLPDHLVAAENVVNVHGQLINNMETLRETLNTDEDYVAFKTIVGDKSVFPHMWEEDRSDFKRDEAVRHERQNKLAETITVENWPLWKSRLATAASVKSNNPSTLSPYARFLSVLADGHPALAFDLLTDREIMPTWTIRPIVAKLLDGDLRPDVEALLNGWLDEGRFVQETAALTVFPKNVDAALIRKTAMRAVEDGNEGACASLLEAAIRQFTDDPAFWRDEIFFPCLAALKQADSYYWIDCSWYQPGEDSLFSNLTEPQSGTVLEAMLRVPRIDYAAEQILQSIASTRHQMVLDWFGQRIESASEEPSVGFDAVPFSFQSVHEVLQPHSRDILASMRRWLDRADDNGSGDVSHFLSRIYPNFEEPLPSTLLQMAEGANANDLTFIASSLQGFQGRDDLLPLLRAVLASGAATDDIEGAVSQVFHETGIMRGEFGPEKTYQAKADLLRPWLEDDNDRVSAFAAGEVGSLERRVADETRRAQEGMAMRKLQYGESLDDYESESNKDIGDHNSSDDTGSE